MTACYVRVGKISPSFLIIKQNESRCFVLKHNDFIFTEACIDLQDPISGAWNIPCLNPTVQSSPASFQFTSAGDNNAFAALRLCLGYFLQTNTRSHQRSFQGCMQMIHIDDHLMDLKAVEQGLIGTFENVSLDMCAIIDRSVSQKL